MHLPYNIILLIWTIQYFIYRVFSYLIISIIILSLITLFATCKCKMRFFIALIRIFEDNIYKNK